MVGRPGRSKGCSNCRRRKKGCDLARPCCGQCIKNKIKCAGYNDNLDLIVYTPSASNSQLSLRKTAMEVQYIDTFRELLLPKMSKPSRPSNGDWVHVIRDRYKLEGPFKKALLALTLSRVGQYSGDDRVARSGSIYYNACLREVVRTIDLQKGACGEEVIAVCLILSLYEVLCSPASPGVNWQRHMRGIGTLIQLRGPQAFASGLAHYLFVSARLDIIFDALVSRKGTFLDSFEWLTVPWTAHSTRSLYDRIVDLCTQLPRILEMMDQIHILKPRQTCDLEPLLVACWRLDGSLQRWYQDLSAACSQARTNGARTQPPPDLDTPLTAETEINHEYAEALSAYWMACCFLYTALRLIWQESDSPSHLLPQRIDPLRYASLISKSLPYFSTPSAGERALICYSISMGAALHCLSVTDELETLDAQRIINTFDHEEYPSAIGARVGVFLRTLAAANVNVTFSLEHMNSEKVTEMGKKWWGGGTKEVTLRPRTSVLRQAAMSRQNSGEPP